ncbi:MAG: hypothetical protein AAGD09_18960 [Cyanobacteria bacterium P01_F01_bin.56]
MSVLKSGEATSITQAARIVSHDCSTGQRWLQNYKQLGLSGLLNIGHSRGRQAAVPSWTQNLIRMKLRISTK